LIIDVSNAEKELGMYWINEVWQIEILICIETRFHDALLLGYWFAKNTKTVAGKVLLLTSTLHWYF
tara:strand:- start:100 stop:297 length:198 start_codon:yes stop_codon:yes gene_type:complete